MSMPKKILAVEILKSTIVAPQSFLFHVLSPFSAPRSSGFILARHGGSFSKEPR